MYNADAALITTIEDAELSVWWDLIHSNVIFRKPVVEDDVDLNIDGTNIKWRNAVSELLSIIVDQEKGAEYRRVVIGIGGLAVSEALPGTLIKRISKVEPVAAATQDEDLKIISGYDVVPEEYYKTGIAHAPGLITRVGAVRHLAGLRYTYLNDEGYAAPFKEILDRITHEPGISRIEKELVIARMGMARDTKILSLAAELMEYDGSTVRLTDSTGNRQIDLTNCTITLGENQDAGIDDLLDPGGWKGVDHVGGRVSELRTKSGRKYILKERRTPAHAAQFEKFGFRTPATAAEEYAIATELPKQYVDDYDEIVLEWEKPIGYIEFIDGHQICIFEHEPMIAKIIHPRHELEKKIIIAGEAVYNNDYQAVLRGTKAMLGLGCRKITFEEFAKIKAYCMVMRAEDLTVLTAIKSGYKNQDSYRIRFDVVTGDDGKARLRTINYDLEYYVKAGKFDQEPALAKVSAAQNKSAQKLNWINSGSKDDAYRAACFAVLQLRGYKLPNNS